MDVELLTRFESEQIGQRQPLPDRYLGLSDEEMEERIARARADLGSRLLILGHHYQRDEVIRFADCTGDSFKLARQAAERSEADYIVFCGVHFMAESADVLSGPHQQVLLPDLAAGCSMADMAEADQLEVCWDELLAMGATDVVPVTYINSAAAIKAFCGERGGVVCTSSNAGPTLEWAWKRGRRILFLPGSASGPQHRLQDGRAARRDGGLGSGSGVRRRGARSPAGRPDAALEGPLLGPHALQRQAGRASAARTSGHQGHRSHPSARGTSFRRQTTAAPPNTSSGR